jgi:hypothetical protein
MSVYRIKMEPGQEPHEWKAVKFAEIGGNEMFVRHMIELRTIVDATSICDPQREDVKNAIMSILADGLMPAFNELKKILAAREKELPLMDRRELFHGFYGKLWKAYKELTQRAAKAAGFNVGFLFTADKDFTNGLIELHANHPSIRSELDNALLNTRQKWQSELANFRNSIIEHPDADATRFEKFYTPDYSEWLFMEVWNTIVDLLAVLLESRLSSGMKLGLPDLEKYPNWDNRFMFYHPGFEAKPS